MNQARASDTKIVRRMDEKNKAQAVFAVTAVVVCIASTMVIGANPVYAALAGVASGAVAHLFCKRKCKSETSMTELQKVARRTNLMWVWGGLANLLIALAGALAIWVYPFVGPDLRSEFCALLVPFLGFGLAATLVGLHELRAAKKRAW